MLVLSFSALFSAENILKILLFSSVHELCHLLVLVLVGGRADTLNFSFYGIALKYSSKLSRIKEFFVILAGPFANLILYLIFKDAYNLSLLILNLLPIYPLDGGRLLDIYSYRVSSIVSKIFLFILVIFSLFMLIFYNSYSLLLISVYLFFYTINY